MKINFRLAQIIFAVPWIIFGIQHFIYADFVAGLVPDYFPARYYWGLLAGAAMIAAGMSFIFNTKSALAGVLLAALMLIFTLLIHIPTISGEPAVIKHWTRCLEDLSLAAAALMLAEIASNGEAKNHFLKNAARLSRFILAFILVIFGFEHFFNLDFFVITSPDFLPQPQFWNCLSGAVLMIAGVCVLINKKAVPSAFISGWSILIITLLSHGYILANDLHNPLNWTAAMFDLAVADSILILAISLSKEQLTASRKLAEREQPAL